MGISELCFAAGARPSGRFNFGNFMARLFRNVHVPVPRGSDVNVALRTPNKHTLAMPEIADFGCSTQKTFWFAGRREGRQARCAAGTSPCPAGCLGPRRSLQD